MLGLSKKFIRRVIIVAWDMAVVFVYFYGFLLIEMDAFVNHHNSWGLVLMGVGVILTFISTIMTLVLWDGWKEN